MRTCVPVLSLVLLPLLAASCGTPMSTTFNTTSPQPVAPTLRCVLFVTDSLGYKARLVNGSQGVEATHNDSALASYEDGRFEKISATGKNSKSNDGSSSLVVTAMTISQHWTRIGLESDEVPASDRVKQDAKTLVARCGGGS